MYSLLYLYKQFTRFLHRKVKERTEIRTEHGRYKVPVQSTAWYVACASYVTAPRVAKHHYFAYWWQSLGLRFLRRSATRGGAPS